MARSFVGLRPPMAAIAVVAALVAELAAAQLPEPVVEFIGRAPKLRIYPGGNSEMDSDSNETDTWLMLTFGKIEEMDASGGRVAGRAIMSLAAEKGIIWTQENRTVGGARALVTRMELPLEYGGSFKETCAGGGGGGSAGGGGAGNAGGGSTPDSDSKGNGKDKRRLASTSFVAVEIFVFSADAVVEYGDYVVQVTRGQLKFNVESEGWPFCGTDHKLEVNLDIKVPGDKPPKSVEEGKEAPGEEKKGRKPKSKAVKQSAGGRDVSFDLPEVALVDNSSSASEVLVDSNGGKTTIAFRFPYFESTLLYDPTVGFEAEAMGESPPPTTTTGAVAATTAAPGVETTSAAAPTTKPGATVVSGSLKMSVEDPAAFCDSADVIMALRKAIARASKQDVSGVAVTCTVAAARRLQEARRLAGMVDVGYTVTIPPGSSSATSDAAMEALTTISTEELTTIVNEELTSSGAGVEAQVTAKGAITKADPDASRGMASAAPARAPAGAGGALGIALVALAAAHRRA